MLCSLLKMIICVFNSYHKMYNIYLLSPAAPKARDGIILVNNMYISCQLIDLNSRTDSVTLCGVTVQ